MYGSELVMILGKSGSGKSSAIGKMDKFGIKGLNPQDTFLINVDGKRLGADNGHEWNIDNKNIPNFEKLKTVLPNLQWDLKGIKNPENIKALLDLLKQVPNIKNIVIDDYQYSWADTFVDGIKKKIGLGLYTDIVYDIASVIDKAKALRPDQIVFFISHTEEYDEYGAGGMKQRMKAVGESTHKRLAPEGKANTVLFAEGRTEMKDGKPVYKKYFRTQGDGVHDPCKSPNGLFDDENGNQMYEIPNDLGFVEQRIRYKYKM